MGPDLTCQGPHGLLVVEDDVRPPDEFRWDADGGDILVVTRVPAQFVVMPLLGGSGEPCVRGIQGRGQRWGYPGRSRRASKHKAEMGRERNRRERLVEVNTG